MEKIDKTLIMGIILAGMIIGFGAYNIYKDNNKVDTYQIKVNTNGGVPYSWSYEIDNDTIVEIKESSKALNQNDGGPVEVYYDMTPKKEGKATLMLEYKDIRDNHVEEEQKYEINVTHDLKMTVKKIR